MSAMEACPILSNRRAQELLPLQGGDRGNRYDPTKTTYTMSSPNGKTSETAEWSSIRQSRIWLKSNLVVNPPRGLKRPARFKGRTRVHFFIFFYESLKRSLASVSIECLLTVCDLENTLSKTRLQRLCKLWLERSVVLSCIMYMASCTWH